MVKYLRNNTPLKMFLVLLTGAFLLFLIFMVSNSASKLGEHPVQIVVAPSGATVLIDGETVESDELYLGEGTYTFTISKEGFETLEVDHTVPGLAGNDLIVSLWPISDAAWEETRGDDAFLEHEAAAGRDVEDRSAKFIEDNPILEDLPYRGPLFDIDYRLNGNLDEGITLVVTLYDPAGEELSLSQLNYWGYDPTSFEIDFINSSSE